MTALVILEGIVILLLTVLVAGLLRSHAEILRRLHEMGAGEADHGTQGLQLRPAGRATTVDAIAGATPSGGEASIALTGSRGLVLAAFLTSGCASCRIFWDAFRGGVALPHPDIRTVIVTKGPAEESPATIRNLAPVTVPTIMSSEAWDTIGVPMAPYFALVDASRGVIIGEGAAGSWEHVSDLLARAVGDSAVDPHQTLTAGTAQRLRDTDEELRRAGIEPGDDSLYRAPGDGETP
jgi:hypothetical protein